MNRENNLIESENISSTITNSAEKELSERHHLKARKEAPAAYPSRYDVPDDKVDWNKEYPEYKPEYFVAQSVLDNDHTKKAGGWADPEEIPLNKKYISSEGEIKLDENGRPRNPKGRTGIEGRGLLGKWGPNFAADPIVTRINPGSGGMEMLAIQRKDNKNWAIPGGMVDSGEKVTATLKREFLEETGVDLDMGDARQIYKGYVDDPRNTDNAWIETVASHKHLSTEIARKVRPQAGDDAQDARWMPITKENLKNFYASHEELVKKALADFYFNNTGQMSLELKKQIELLLE